MGQVKIYGIKPAMKSQQETISTILHNSLVECFKIPADKKFQRFIWLEKDDFYFPEDRSTNYLIIEISIFEGRSDAVKRNLIKILFQKFSEEMNLSPQDLEITLFETPKVNWGIRGKNAEDLQLTYNVNL